MFWTLLFLLFHCLSPDFSFQGLRKASLSYPMAIKIHDCCLAPSMSFLATLLLLQPMPLSLPTAHLDLKASISAPGGNMGTSTSLNHHSWWFKSCCFCSVHISFSHPILTSENNCLGHTWLFSKNLRMNCYTWCRDLNHTIRILFWTFAHWMNLSVKKGMLGRQLIRKLAGGLMKWGSWLVSAYCLVLAHQSN